MRQLLIVLPTVLAACGPNAVSPAASAPAAKVTGAVPEAALASVTLTAAATARLGIETAPVERRRISTTRSLGGEIVPAGGAQLSVTAPVAGTLSAGAPAPVVGTTLTSGALVLTLVPLAPAERDVRVEAERAVGEAVGRHEMAAKRAQRARTLAQDGSGSVRASEEAVADLAVADAALTAARKRLALAARGVSASGGIRVTSPKAGVLRALYADAGQTVAAGAPLFDVVGLEPVWLRVPVFAGDFDALDRRASVTVVPLGATPGDVGRTATPIAAPPTADVATAGVDLFYRLGNADGSLRPGQRVSVRVPLVTGAEHLVVARGAVLFDALGGTWVYEARGGGVFVRRRITLIDTIGETAVLSQGPAPGTRVVTTGAAELFGTEFGVGK